MVNLVRGPDYTVFVQIHVAALISPGSVVDEVDDYSDSEHQKPQQSPQEAELLGLGHEASVTRLPQAVCLVTYQYIHHIFTGTHVAVEVSELDPRLTPKEVAQLLGDTALGGADLFPERADR